MAVAVVLATPVEVALAFAVAVACIFAVAIWLALTRENIPAPLPITMRSASPISRIALPESLFLSDGGVIAAGGTLPTKTLYDGRLVREPDDGESKFGGALPGGAHAFSAGVLPVGVHDPS